MKYTISALNSVAIYYMHISNKYTMLYESYGYITDPERASSKYFSARLMTVSRAEVTSIQPRRVRPSFEPGTIFSKRSAYSLALSCLPLSHRNIAA